MRTWVSMAVPPTFAVRTKRSIPVAVWKQQGRAADISKKVLTDKGWLARVNAHLGQYGRAADLWHDSETIHTAGGMDTTGPSSRTLNSLYLRVFKLNNPVRQQAMGPPSEVPRPLHMP